MEWPNSWMVCNGNSQPPLEQPPESQPPLSLSPSPRSEDVVFEGSLARKQLRFHNSNFLFFEEVSHGNVLFKSSTSLGKSCMRCIFER